MFQSLPSSYSPNIFASLPGTHGLGLAGDCGYPTPEDDDGGSSPTSSARHQQLFPAPFRGGPRHRAASWASPSCATAPGYPQHPQLDQPPPHHRAGDIYPLLHSCDGQEQNSLQHHQSNRLDANMDGHDDHGMAAQQEAAKEYQPDLKGPMVGERTSSEEIVSEYAKADQVYVEKTISLPQSYSHYRPIKGDGNCGWRAIGFAYFEQLIEQGDQAQVEGEVARLMSLNQMLATVGGYDYFEDFADEVFDLLREVAGVLAQPETAHKLVMDKWNDPATEGSLIYYFRLLAATYLKSNAATYDNFVPNGQGIASYCSQNIEIVNREIEQLGIVALVNILLKPVNFVLEIAYLDRSPGSQVNKYRFPEEANQQEASELGPTIYLLYRPDHYDILYRLPAGEKPAATAAAEVSMQVNRVSGFTHNTAFTNAGGGASLGAFSTLAFDTLSMIPGLSTTGGGGMSGMLPMPGTAVTASPTGSDTFASGQSQAWLQQFGSDTQSNDSASSTHLIPHQSSSTPPIVQGPAIGQTSSLINLPGSTDGYPIRFSPHQLEYENNGFPEPIFQVTTSTFKNSVWNRAHYGNPDFQPEAWNPDDDGSDARVAGKKKARKDSA